MKRKRCLSILLLIAGLAGGLLLRNSSPVGAVHASDTPKLYLDSPRALLLHYKGRDTSVQSVRSSAATAISLASDDLDKDGVLDLIAGYGTAKGGVLAIHRGDLDAFAPQSQESFDAIAKGEFPSPFATQADVVESPVRPDFLAAGHFAGQEQRDLIVAARGGKTLYRFSRDTDGAFTVQQSIDVGGSITAVSAYLLDPQSAYSQVLVGIHTTEGSALLIYSGAVNGLALTRQIPLDADAKTFAFGALDSDTDPDVAILAGAGIAVLHGRDLLTDTVRLQPVSIAAPAVQIALGAFIPDRDSRLQMAVLSADGTVHFLAHKEFDPTPYSAAELRALAQEQNRNRALSDDWKEVETVSAASAFDPAHSPLMMRTRISGQGADDVLLIDAAAGRITAVSHPKPIDNDGSFAPAMLLSRTDAMRDVVAALPMRVNVDGRPGLILLKNGQTQPSVMMPLPDPTFTVNRFDDITPRGTASTCLGGSNDCTLREAVIKANSTGGCDTIMVPAGTYTLTLTGTNNHQANVGRLDIQDCVSIVGTTSGGAPASVIQAGTTTSNGIDKVFSINPDHNKPFDTAMSNLVIQFGRNPYSFGTDGAGGGFDWEGSQTGNLTVTNCTVQNNSTTDGNGGGIWANNLNIGTGVFTISNSIIQNNVVQQSSTGNSGNGGGIWVGPSTAMVMTNTQVLNNSALQTAGAEGEGGGLYITIPKNTHTRTAIHASTISGNHAAGSGGGIFSGQGALIDQNTVISNNQAGVDGGGVWASLQNDTMTITQSTITGNSAVGNGGGIRVDVGAQANEVDVTFSRIAGNSSASGSGLSNSTTATVVATDDWWGCNQGPSSAPCDRVAGPTATTTSSPWLTLSHTASPVSIVSGQTSTLTASFLQDNLGTAVSAANLTAFVGLPITFGNPVDGTLSNAQTTIQSNGTATATFTGTTSGPGSATATVDNFSVTANINVVGSATISTSFGAGSIPLSGSTSVSFLITNTNTTGSLTGIAFSDSLPSGLVVATPNGLSGSCGGGTITAVANTGSISLSGATLAANASCSFSVNVTGTAAGTLNNTTGNISSNEAGIGGTSNTATLFVVAPPSIAKQFSGSTVPLNQNTTLTFTISNPSANTVAESGVAFTDNLPSGLVVATPNGVTNNCGGSVTATSGAGSLSLSGGSIATNSSCTLSVSINATTAGVKNNTTGSVTSTNGGTGNTASASITVGSPATISNSFGVSSIALNTNTTLSFTITNPNPTIGLSNVAFTDSLPSGVVVATPNGLTGACGSGTITATAGSSSVSLSAGTIASSGSCSFTINVTGTTGGVKNNTTGAVSSTEGGTGSASNTATLTVVAPPTVSKNFGAASIPLSGSTSLTFTITNPNATASLSNVSFSDSLPSGLVISNPSNLSGNCTASITANSGATSISFSGGSLAAGGSCSFNVNVTGTTNGDKSNTTGAISSTEGGTGTTSNTVVLSVVSPPSIAKVFGASNLALNTSTTLTFTISSAAGNTLAESGVAFTDTLPAGLVVATPNGLSSTCGGTPTAVAGSNSISLSGGTAAVNGSCTLIVNVTGTTEGQKNNLSGAVSSTNGGTGNTASASITVAAPPTISTSFGASTIPVGATTTLNFTVTSVNTVVTLHNIAFTDNLPTGLAVASPNGLTTTCNGGITATPGATSVSMANTSLAPGASCTISLNLLGVGLGVLNNTTSAITSSEGGTGSTSNTATIIVIGPPAISQGFGASSVPLNGSTTLTFTVMNLNTTSGLSGIGFADTLPSGLVISTPNGLTNTCGGTASGNQGGNSISLTGGVLPISSSCTVVVSVTGTTAGDQLNISGNVTSTEGGTGLTSSATLSVVAPPSMTQAFGVATLPVNTVTTLTFTITNPADNTLTQNGVAFSDTLPSGLVVATPNGVTQTCSGTVTATSGTNSISLSGGSIPVNSSCNVVVNVTGTTEGLKSNTSSAVSSTNGGTGNTTNATISVGAPPTISNAFGVSQIPVGGSTSLTFSIANPNSVVTLNSIAFTDSLPSGVVVSSPNSLTTTCSGTPVANSGGGVISLSGASLTPGASCTLALNVTGVALGVKLNSVGSISSTEGGTGSGSNTATLTVVGPPAIGAAFGASSIPLNGNTTLTFTLTNLNSTVGLSGIGFTDALPAGLALANPVNLNNTCGGTPTATSGGTSVSLTGGTIGAGTSCTVAVTVTGTAAGDQPTTTSVVTSTEGGTGTTSNTATVSVVAPPSIAKAFGTAHIAANTSTTLTFTITNPAANTLAQSGVAFTDTLPAGLVVSTPNGLANACNGTPTATAGSNSISLTGGTLAVNTSCTLTVNVTGVTEGQKNNVSGAVSSTNGGTGNTASATVTVAAPPTITAAFGNAQIPLGGSTSLTFNITSPNTAITLTGIAFTDSLPSGLVVASPSGITTTCDGTVTAGEGSGSVSLSGASLTAGASCTISLNVTGTVFGVKNNTTGAITSTEGGTGATSNAITVTVIGPPTISANFAGPAVPLNQSINLSLKVTNPNPTVGLTGISFSDTLPAGLSVSSPNGLSNTCGGSVSAVAGGNSISLSGGTVAANSNCTITVSVTGTTPGDQATTTGAVTSTEGGAGTTSNTAIVSVVAPAAIAKAFGATSIPLNGSTSLTLTISNPAGNTAAQSGVAFTDNMPSGLAVSSPSGLTNTCGGTATATPGSGTVSLTGATVAVNASCTVVVNVTGNAVGVKNNSTTVSSTNGGTGNTGTATMTVATPPSVVANFAPSSIPLAGTSVLTLSVTNPNNGLGLTGVQFTNNLPTGLKMASPAGAINTCGGTLAAPAGGTSLALSGGSVPSNSSCTVTVTVVPTAAGSVTDSTGVVSSIESGPGSASNVATLTVVAPPVFAGSFSTDTIQIGGTTTLTLTLTNPPVNTAPQTGVSFTDALPAGLTLATPPNVTNTCGGSFVAQAGDGAFTLSNGTVAVNSSCTFSVNVIASTGGVKNNVTGPVMSSNGGSGNGATASLNVQVPVTVTATPAGRTFVVDGTSYTTTQNFTWDAGSTHTIAAPSPQQVGKDTSTQYAFDSWSDGGTISHNVTVPAAATTYTAKFTTVYALNISGSPDEGGSTTPSSNQYFAAGSTVQLTATPFACFAFSGWTGQVASSSSLTTSIVMSGPQTVIAHFSGIATCGNNGRPSLTLVPTPPEGGSLVATPSADSSGTLAQGANVQIQAAPNTGYFFLGFSSDLTGTDNPQSLVMDSNKTVFGFFAKIPTGPEQLDFAYQRGNPVPAPQSVNGANSLVGIYPQSGGNWLIATIGPDGQLQLSLNADAANALPDGIYDSYVVTGNNSSPTTIRVRLFINSLQINSVADSAGYRPSLIASDGLFSAFGVNLANQALGASNVPLPQNLAGSSVTVTDSSGATSTAQLLYVSPTQINLLTPVGLAVGPAKVTITNASGASGSFPVKIGSVAPGLFSANATGTGPAAAVIQTVAADGTSAFTLAADCQTTPGKCVSVPIKVNGSGTGVYLSLYGTGLRGRSSLSNVTITIGGVPIAPLYAGLQSQFPGLDQVNVQLPATLAGLGEVDVVVMVDGQPANTVRIAIQ